jgi:hypothetical protein
MVLDVEFTGMKKENGIMGHELAEKDFPNLFRRS